MVEERPGFTELKLREEALVEIAQDARRQFFGVELRNQASLEQESLNSKDRRKIARRLNKILQEGGHVIVIDFPFPPTESDSARIQVVSQNSYLMLLHAVAHLARDFQYDRDFALEIKEPIDKNVVGALSLSVITVDRGRRDHVHSIFWNEREAEKRRFAVITRDKEKRWQVALDFRFPTDLANPAWKINPEFLS